MEMQEIIKKFEEMEKRIVALEKETKLLRKEIPENLLNQIKKTLSKNGVYRN